jgi:hypothetical protein
MVSQIAAATNESAKPLTTDNFVELREKVLRLAEGAATAIADLDHVDSGLLALLAHASGAIAAIDLLEDRAKQADR